jgi:hypothetical protein
MRITAKYAGKCTECGTWFPEGAKIEWDKIDQTTIGECCYADGDADAIRKDAEAMKPKPKTRPVGDEDLYPTSPNEDDAPFDPDWEDDPMPF